MSNLGEDPATVLLVEPRSGRRERVQARLSDADGLTVDAVEGPEAALAALAADDVECVLAAHELPEGDGLDLLEQVCAERPHLPFVLFPADGSEALASRAIAAGASDYVAPETLGDGEDVDDGEGASDGEGPGDGEGTGDGYEGLGERLREHVDAGREARAWSEPDRRFRTLVETLPGIAYRSGTDDSWPFEYVEGECEATTGYTAAELREEVDWEYDVIRPEDREHVRDEIETAVAAGESFEVTYRIETADGETRWLWERGREVEDGVLEGFVTDVTGRRARERELRETNELLGAVVEASPAALMAIDRDGETILWNPTAEEIFGWEESEVLGEPLPFVPEDRQEEFWEFRERLLAGESITDVETQRLRKDGERIDVHLSIAPAHDADGDVVATAAMLDITDRKERERELQRTKELLTSAERMGDVGAWEVDLETREIYWSAGIRRIFEVTGDFEPDLERILDFCHPADREAFADQLAEFRETGGSGEVTFRITTAEGRQRWLHTEGEVVEGDDGTRLARGVVHDVTERTERERELRRTQELLTSAERMADVGAWEWDPATDEVRWSDGIRRIFEVSEEFEPTVESLLEFCHPDDRETFQERLAEFRETGRFEPMTFRIVTAGGRERWLYSEGEAIEREDGTRVVRGFTRDVTERKRRDHQVAVLDRVLRHNLRTDVDEIVERARTIADRTEGAATDSASAIVERGTELRTLADKHREVAKLLSEGQSVHEYDVRRMLERVVDQMRETYPGAEIDCSCPPPVEVVATSEVEAAVAELVENGIQHSDADVPAVEVSAELTDDAVEVRVADNGPGIPERERETIRRTGDVDPLDHGGGMGLWLAKWIVSRSGGTLRFADSEPRGTEVQIRLPRTSVEHARGDAASDAEQQSEP